MFGKAWQRYQACIHAAPLRTNMVTAGCVMLFGDALAQWIERERKCEQAQDASRDGDAFNGFRWATMASWNATVFSPVFFYWFGFLDRRFPGAGLRNVAAKVLVNQAIITIPLNGAALAYSVSVEQGLRAAAGEREWDSAKVGQAIAARWNSDLGTIFVSSAAWWVPVNTLNFLFVPAHLRVLPTIFGAVVWNTFFSLTAHREQSASPAGNGDGDGNGDGNGEVAGAAPTTSSSAASPGSCTGSAHGSKLLMTAPAAGPAHTQEVRGFEGTWIRDAVHSDCTRELEQALGTPTVVQRATAASDVTKVIELGMEEANEVVVRWKQSTSTGFAGLFSNNSTYALDGQEVEEAHPFRRNCAVRLSSRILPDGSVETLSRFEGLPTASTYRVTRRLGDDGQALSFEEELEQPSGNVIRCTVRYSKIR